MTIPLANSGSGSGSSSSKHATAVRHSITAARARLAVGRTFTGMAYGNKAATNLILQVLSAAVNAGCRPPRSSWLAVSICSLLPQNTSIPCHAEHLALHLLMSNCFLSISLLPLPCPQVMPDPPNAKQPTDTAAAAEHAAAHRGDQVPGIVPGTRTAAGSGSARSRSYSGDGAPAGTSNDRIQLARSGSTTANTRAQSQVRS
jgi:hypothetical protein